MDSLPPNKDEPKGLVQPVIHTYLCMAQSYQISEMGLDRLTGCLWLNGRNESETVKCPAKTNDCNWHNPVGEPGYLNV
jgi:hypothetical protein